MHWNSSDNAGFTSGTPWLPLNENYTEINAQQCQSDPDSVYHYYRQLVALRKGQDYGDVIVYGSHTLLDPLDKEVYAYVREYQGKKLLIIANFTGQAQQRGYPYKVINSVLSNTSIKVIDLDQVTLEPWAGHIIEIR
jgi:oligo-1,6-glucosidase